MNFIEFGFALLVGVGIGLFFFGGLWFTVRQMTSNPSGFTAVFCLLSFGVRMLLLAACLWFMLHCGIEFLLVSVAGMLLVRWWMVRKVKAIQPIQTLKGPA